MKCLRVFTDGATPNNGSRTAKGGIGIFWGDDSPHNHSECFSDFEGHKVTNNIMELLAIRKAIDAYLTQSEMMSGKTCLIIYTDSMYAMRTLTEWASSWEKRGWKKADGKTPENLGLIQNIYRYVQKYPITFKHCNSHTKSPLDKNSEEYFIWYGNAMADRLATSCIM